MSHDGHRAWSAVAEPELAGLAAVSVGVALLALATGELAALAVAVATMLVVLATTEALSRRGGGPDSGRSRRGHGAHVGRTDPD